MLVRLQFLPVAKDCEIAQLVLDRSLVIINERLGLKRKDEVLRLEIGLQICEANYVRSLGRLRLLIVAKLSRTFFPAFNTPSTHLLKLINIICKM